MVFRGEISATQQTLTLAKMRRELLVKYFDIWSKVSDFHFLTKYYTIRVDFISKPVYWTWTFSLMGLLSENPWMRLQLGQTWSWSPAVNGKTIVALMLQTWLNMKNINCSASTNISNFPTNFWSVKYKNPPFQIFNIFKVWDLPWACGQIYLTLVRYGWNMDQIDSPGW